MRTTLLSTPPHFLVAGLQDDHQDPDLTYQSLMDYCTGRNLHLVAPPSPGGRKQDPEQVAMGLVLWSSTGMLGPWRRLNRRTPRWVCNGVLSRPLHRPREGRLRWCERAGDCRWARPRLSSLATSLLFRSP